MQGYKYGMWINSGFGVALGYVATYSALRLSRRDARRGWLSTRFSSVRACRHTQLLLQEMTVWAKCRKKNSNPSSCALDCFDMGSGGQGELASGFFSPFMLTLVVWKIDLFNAWYLSEA